MAKATKGHDYSTTLIWSAAVVTVVRYSAAFIASDMGEITGVVSEVITVLMGLSGLGMGILDVLGGTYLFDAVRRKMPKSGEAWKPQFKVLVSFVVALMITGVLILVPFTVSRVTHKSMAAVLGEGLLLAGWALLVNLAPYLLIGGVAVGNQVVSVDSGHMTGQLTEVSESDRETTGQLSGQTYPTDWRKVRKLLTDAEVSELAKMSTEQICFKYGVLDRTARRWREKALAEVSVTMDAQG